ncbi:NFX1-type zinc finger-containing protein 1 [Caerostris extrusa]|uniref:NFX1-type zinc finger-containing protein 1 n=1 Tax=Caerostris extrusa TaxID=172846 RepID=A0AAV4Q8G1_CAEEX|nr:NFX1-type zinc finger-containing protein 1 [Caerostris extrusa]
MCQNHPGVSHAVATESDFDLVPGGGCTRPCEFRLPCGHACSLKCHPFDSEHKDIRCPKPCTKQCSKGHFCNSKCSEKCPPCTFEISKTVEKCGHIIKVPCYCENKKIICTHPCEKSFPCGHGCRAKCGESCSIECNEMVEVQSKVCGHNLRIKCSKSEDIASLLKSCKEACGVKLPCGHICTGTCSNCFQGRLHVACRKACERTLTCGHTCKSVCHLSCPPCVEKCENWCSHGKCNKECCDPCEKCTEPCGWICPHKSCTRLCWEPCNRTACEKPCPKTLKCEHPCIGICGEPCPAECRICDEEKMKSLHFGLEAEDSVKFVLLEDCNHVFEVNRLQEWMTQDVLSERRIHFKVCPECNTVIRRNVHFEKVVKSYLEDMEKVNETVSGSKKVNRELLDRIRFGKLSFSFFFSFWCSLESYLDFENGISYRKLTAVENFINIFSFSNDVQDLDESSVYFFPEKLIKMFEYFKNIFKNQLATFLDDMYFKVSEDQMKDVVWEIHRIKLLDELEKFLIKIITNKHISIYKDNKAYFKRLIGYVTTYKPFRNEELKKFISDYQIVYKLFNGGEVNASDLEKHPVLKGMGLSRDNWYRCPNGDVWSFIQYGNAAIENKCLQCEEQVKPPSCTTT